MKSCKATGPGGFPVEFFKAFLELLLTMETTFNSILETGEMPPSWRQATLIPIPKPNKDKTLCSSYRPIALWSNVDALFSIARYIKQFEPED